MLQKDIERFEIFGVDGKWLIKDNEQLPNLLDCYQSCVRLNQQAQRIAELEEQLKNAIVPKFKIGQTSYYIFNGVVGIFKPEKVCEVRDLLISGIQFYGQEIQYQTTYGLFNEKDLFTLKEEALAKLKELQGETK